jgi:hypothetical protein
MVAIKKEGNDWVCRFERGWLTEWQGGHATWIEIVDVKVNGRAPDISHTRCKTGTDLRPLPPEVSRSMTAYGGKKMLLIGHDRRVLENRGLGERQVSDWVSIGRQRRS